MIFDHLGLKITNRGISKIEVKKPSRSETSTFGVRSSIFDICFYKGSEVRDLEISLR